MRRLRNRKTYERLAKDHAGAPRDAGEIVQEASACRPRDREYFVVGAVGDDFRTAETYLVQPADALLCGVSLSEFVSHGTPCWGYPAVEVLRIPRAKLVATRRFV